MHKTLLGYFFAAALIGCGGGSSERVDALEAQIRQLKQNSANAATVSKLGRKLDQTIKTTEASIEKLETLVEEQANATPAAAPAPARSSVQDGNAIVGLIDVILDPEKGVVDVDGDSYRVSLVWLRAQGQQLAAKGGLKLASKKGGIQLRGVKRNSLPARLGLKNGDIITNVAGKATSDVASLREALSSADGDTLEVGIKRRAEEITLTYSFK